MTPERCNCGADDCRRCSPATWNLPTCPGCGDQLEPEAFICSTKVCETCCSDGCDGRCDRAMELYG